MRDANINWKEVAIFRQQLLNEKRKWMIENGEDSPIEISRLNHRIDIYEELKRKRGPRPSKSQKQ